MPDVFFKAWDLIKYRGGVLRCSENCMESLEAPAFRVRTTSPSGADIEVNENGEVVESLFGIDGLSFYCSHCYNPANVS